MPWNRNAGVAGLHRLQRDVECALNTSWHTTSFKCTKASGKLTASFRWCARPAVTASAMDVIEGNSQSSSQSGSGSELDRNRCTQRFMVRFVDDIAVG